MESTDDASTYTPTPGATQRRPRVAVWAAALGVLATVSGSALYYRSAQILERATLRLIDETGQPVAGLNAFATHTMPYRSWCVGLGTSDEQGYVDLTELKALGLFGSVEFVVQMVGFETPDPAWQEDMTIVVPQHGHVTLQLVDADDVPWTAAHVIDTGLSTQWSDGWGHRSASFDEQGRVELGPVACGRELTLDLRFHLCTTTAKLTPPAPGEHRLQRIPVPEEQPRLRGSLVREDGQAIADQVWLKGNLRSDRGGASDFSAFHLQPAADGGFEFLLGQWPETGSVTIGDRDGRTATVELQPIATGHALDVGELRLSR